MSVKKIPYGVSNFKVVIDRNMLYIRACFKFSEFSFDCLLWKQKIQNSRGECKNAL